MVAEAADAQVDLKLPEPETFGDLQSLMNILGGNTTFFQRRMRLQMDGNGAFDELRGLEATLVQRDAHEADERLPRRLRKDAHRAMELLGAV